MGGLFHIFDFNRGNMARKVKRHGGGMEAPRNSLELPVVTMQNYCAVGDSIPYSYQVKRDWMKSRCNSTEASMKKLINEEIAKAPNTRRNAPGIVARLMGVDVIPINDKQIAQSTDKRNGISETKASRKERTRSRSFGHISFDTDSSRVMKPDPFDHSKDRELDGQNNRYGKPKPREHPQEEELRKFKKEFEAWQAARLRECSKVVGPGSVSSQLLAQEDLNKEKMAIYAPSRQSKEIETSSESKDHLVKVRLLQSGGSEPCGHKLGLFAADEDALLPGSKTIYADLDQFSLQNSRSDLGRYPAPTRIVILKPGYDRVDYFDDSGVSSAETSRDRGGIEDFLEEVKERLKCEIQGKAYKRGKVVRGAGIETPFHEKASDPKQIAQHIAKRVRESVSRDLRVNLPRSESTRSYRSEIQFKGPSSPDYIDRDTRRFLSDRMRNVLRRETYLDMPTVIGDSSRSSMLDVERNKRQESGKHVSNWYYTKGESEMQTGSFRHGPEDDEIFHEEISPRNLIRSLSAPVSGTSFGKLLLEDRHVVTGAHIRRKLEAVDSVMVDAKRKQKEKFNFKEKVTNFRYTFTLRGRLFRRKLEVENETQCIELDSTKDLMSGPTVVMNLGDRPENFTEVPPSPASICSSAQEELLWPGDHFSPLSSDTTMVEDYCVPQVFRKINSNLNELRRQLNQLECNGSENTTIKEEQMETEMDELEDQAKTYIRNLLVASGLYNGSVDVSISRLDSLTKPISSCIYEEVEESYRKSYKGKDDRGEADHKLLLDLLNEALSATLGPHLPLPISKLRWVIGLSTLSPPKGKKLLDLVWQKVRVHLYPPTDRTNHSLDNMVAHDLRSFPWSGLINEDVNSLGGEMECLIIGDLIEDVVNDMQV
ncbi:protein of unknown function DUF4378 [Dillenia turbinata]|uniref:DUF4378 domain-containing protein n=1 Tax=Dillenia turbinata TaxID=194707 RepID=A0AAN8UZA5_9MAGN